jgi:hypothetical protein
MASKLLFKAFFYHVHESQNKETAEQGENETRAKKRLRIPPISIKLKH